MKRRWIYSMVACLALGVLALGGLVVAQSTVHHETVIWDFVNGARVAGISILTAINGPTSGVFTFTRPTSGTVSLTVADDDATAALTVLPGGAAALTLGGTSTTAVTVTTDGTGDAEVVLPVNSIGVGEQSGFTQNLVICGDDAGTTTTNYLGPSLPSWTGDGTDYSLASSACSALDSTTEATADLPVSTLALKVHGMRCKSDSTQAAGESLTMTLRTAEADTVPVISCVIGVAATECRTNTATTTNIVAGATLAVKVVPSGNNGAGHVQCLVTLSMP